MDNAIAVPPWVTSGWYTNDPMGQKLAAIHYLMPHSTLAERVAAKAYRAQRARQIVDGTHRAFPCSKCGRFAFAQPIVCFWCRQ